VIITKKIGIGVYSDDMKGTNDTALYFDGVSAYAVIPICFYGWNGFTILERIYAYWPKANTAWSKFSMIGDFWTDKPSIFHGTDNAQNYTLLNMVFVTRKPNGTYRSIDYSWFNYKNQIVDLARTFNLSTRVYNTYINGRLLGATTVPSDEKTILEWNPDTATYPAYYKRFVLGANVVYAEQMKCRYHELQIYNRALPQDKIIYNIQHPDDPVPDGLVGWWKFDEGIGNVIHDYSGNGNHGTIYGGQWVSDSPLVRDIYTPTPGRGFMLRKVRMWTDRGAFPYLRVELRRGEEIIVPTQGELYPTYRPVSFSLEERIASGDTIKLYVWNSDTASGHHVYVQLEGEETP